jgi:glycosyltransferase involved in cell wall biosynthesis
LRIVWASNAPWTPTGYGGQTNQVVSRMHRDGHAVAVAANHGINALSINFNGVPIFPPALEAYGQDGIVAAYDRWRSSGNGEPTVVITLFDVWVYRDPALVGAPSNLIPDRTGDPLPMVSWVPVDHLTVPPEVLAYAAGHRLIAMSKHGRDALTAAGVKADYVPHAIETSVFRPVETDARARLGVPPDAFVVMINAANKGNMPPRKGWGEMLEAFAILAKRHADAYLYLHTDLTGHNGVPLLPLLNLRGIDPERVRIVNQLAYRLNEITPAGLNELYNGADVLLSTSYGEGFGIPVIEAQASGLPVIVTGATAQAELAGPGWAVEWQKLYDVTQGADYAVPIIDSIVESLEAAYQARGDADLRRRCVEFAADYDADTVYQRDWKPLLADLERWIAPVNTRQAKRAAARKAAKGRAA